MEFQSTATQVAMVKEDTRNFQESHSFSENYTSGLMTEADSTQSFVCELCNNSFTAKRSLDRHHRSVHDQQRYFCAACGKLFCRPDKLQKHGKCCRGCPKSFPKCQSCQKKFSTNEGLSNHVCHPRQPPINRQACTHTCRRCGEMFPTYQALYEHRMLLHQQGGADRLQAVPWEEGTAPWEDENGQINDQDLQRMYNMHSSIILDTHQEGNLQSIYNFPVGNDVSIDQLMDQVGDIYERQKEAFRLNLMFGLILRNVESGEYRYFKPYRNEEVFNRPVLVSSQKDLSKVRNQFRQMDVTEYALHQRPDTKWKPHLVTNVRYLVNSSNFTLGHGPIQLPDYIKKLRCIMSLHANAHSDQVYQDQLCAFRCLAFHREPDKWRNHKQFETSVRHYYDQWANHANATLDPRAFRGLRLDQIPEFEKCFEVNVNVFSLTEECVAVPVFKSMCRYKETMHLNLYDRHLSYITKLSAYCRKYQCQTCDKLFDKNNSWHQHQNKCTGQTKYKYPGGFFKASQTIFEELEEYGIMVTESDRFFPWFAVFDMEAVLSKIHEQNSDKLVWSQRHEPISVSICSNIPGFDREKCFVEPDADCLLKQMLTYLSDIAEKASALAELKWEWVLSALNDMKEQWSPAKTASTVKRQRQDDNDEIEDSESTGSDNNPPSEKYMRKADTHTPCHEGLKKEDLSSVASNNWKDVEGDDDDEDMDNDDARMRADQIMYKLVTKLRSKFQAYCTQLPVLGFNSARYDLNLVKQKLARYLKMHESKYGFTVKKNNAYMCMSNDQFKFLDITQYLAPGTSYAGFLKAFHVEESKGFFPYEWFDDVAKLEVAQLPPFGSDWYSHLKNKNVLDDGNKSTEENYAMLQQVWKDRNMKRFQDFLVWYNNLDVGPFVTAVSRLQEFYRQKNIDVFKNSISVPGIARRMLFDTATANGATFAIFDERNKDLFQSIKQNVVGGPSIIFHRHHKANETFIRNNPSKVCKRIVGFDANALYLWAIGEPMPTGPFVRRRAFNNFKPETRDKYMMAYHWMDYLNERKEAHILHKMNHGREKRVGPYPVDGYDPDTNSIYQYHGCYFHGHKCEVTANIKSEKWNRERESKFKKTKECTQFLRDQGYTVVEMWECDFRHLCSKKPELQAFIDHRRPTFFQKNRGSVSTQQILDGVKNKTLFGMVEVDIRVPEEWSPTFAKKMKTPPGEYFSEMSPLFCTTDVPFDAIGSHMQEHVKKYGLGESPRRLLVGGLKGKQMLIATPLLKWYLEHGMEVTQIYQVVEFTSQACFSQFVEQVSTARRGGDADKSMSVIAETMKLIGNSSYGSLLLDKTKHQNVLYIQGENKVCRQVSDPQFRKLTVLEEKEEFYEVEMAKKRIVLDLPIQLGYHILQLAKLRMLEFYYDFMDVYLERSDFEFCEMDTDSAYMAISGNSLEDIVKNEMKSAYLHGLKDFCHQVNIQADAVHHWFPRSCCKDHAKFDKRTPGLFKLEYEGDEMIGLCSKTYIIKKDKERKFSAKGVNKNRLKDPLNVFQGVLDTGKSGSGSNHGFRVRDNQIFTYDQQRNGFTYFYCKRKVLADGVSTKPLDIELCPIRKVNEN